ncbi:DUF952 domain-containing protein [Tropicimonas sp.]|uniref:DUF952 domain-containing protein n=1 Tax=Tropicimonas sp. TaxID=2067044 RepID=UPI003A838D5F
MLVYKIFRRPEWDALVVHGRTRGAPVDEADGFVHFSTAGQLRETAARHFAGEGDLVLATLDTDRLGDALRWEPSRGGALFPHLYRMLELTDVLRHGPLPSGPDGHVFPEDL